RDVAVERRLFVFRRFRNDLAERVEEPARSAERETLVGSDAIDGSDVDLILDGPGGGERLPVLDPRCRKRSGDEPDFGAGEDELAGELGEADVVARHEPDPKAGDVAQNRHVAGANPILLADRFGGDEMRLAVLRDQLATRAEDGGRVVDVAAHAFGEADDDGD